MTQPLPLLVGNTSTYKKKGITHDMVSKEAPFGDFF